MLCDPDFRDLITLPLPTKALKSLIKCGYTNTGEIAGLTADQVSSVCNITKSKATSILQIVQTYTSLSTGRPFSQNDLFFPHTALELLEFEGLLSASGTSLISTCVLSMCKRFDEMMGGGFPCCRITEVCGEPGIGKTQFCLQSCLTVQLPKWCSGLGGEAVFIDTEGNFTSKRLLQMAEALVSHNQKRVLPKLEELWVSSGRDKNDEYTNILADLPETDDLLSKVHYVRCTDYLQLISAVRRLKEFCHYHKNIRLIVVDSIALPFRYEFECVPQRNRLLAALSQSLLAISASCSAAVIVTNQITTRIPSVEPHSLPHSDIISSDGQLIPALGNSWGHICSIRVLLKRSANGGRIAQLLKHPAQPYGSAPYQVTAGGIRDTI